MTKEISELSGVDLIHEVYVGIVRKNIRRGHSKEKNFALLSLEEQTISAIWILDSIIKTGGFELYFRNTNESLSNRAITGLNQLGLESLSKVLKKAITVRNQFDKMKSKKKNTLAILRQEYNYFSLRGQLHKRLENYIRDHRNYFLLEK